MSFTDIDIQQIESNELTVAQINKQIQLFKKGLPYVNLKRATSINDGILVLPKTEEGKYISFFEKEGENLDVLKFVPASGSATRMFQLLYTFLESYNIKEETINSYINKNSLPNLSLFFIGLEKLPFYKIIIEKLGLINKGVTTDQEKLLFVKAMLSNAYDLEYGNLPKGLLPFHSYKSHVSTAFEEHLFEASRYASKNSISKLHFTISKEHHQKFDAEFKRIQKIVSEKTNTTFQVSFSYQKPKTDTVAVTLKNKIFKDDDDNILFRPSGHGALIENLNDLNSDIIFIKNIDNVVIYKYEKEVAQQKKKLAGLLLMLQKQVFAYQKKIDTVEVSEEEIIEIANFLYQKLNVVIHENFEKFAIKYQIEYIKDKINRPIRICGMVKNEGEPGGGPFWVKHENGTISLQIVEASQIDKDNKLQIDILKSATHFNPVDLVCGVKNYKGEKYNLLDFVDEKTAFITLKSKNGKKLKALELPGLWNGAMANWNTVFVEVPLLTFNPVKTVNDLLKTAHQV